MYHVEGSFKVLLVQAAAVGCKKRHCGVQVWAGVCGEPHEAADKGLVPFALSDEYLFILVNVCWWCSINGASQLVRSGERVEVDLGKAVVLNNVLCVRFL